MTDIFVSYRRDDSQWPAGRINERLEAVFGADRVFFDTITIRPGDDFRKVLGAKVGACKVLLAVIGPRWLDLLQARLGESNDFVRVELAEGLRREVRVIPVLIDGAKPPPEARLPDDLKALAWHHAIPVRADTFRSDLDHLIDFLKEFLDGSPVETRYRDVRHKLAEASSPQPQPQLAPTRQPARGPLGDDDRAIADCTEAIRLNPSLSQAYHDRGIAYFNKKDNDRAIADYNEAIRLNPNDGAAYNNRGLAYFDKKDNDRAIADCTEAIRLNPSLSQAYQNRGIAYWAKGDNDRAIADYNEAIRLNPSYANAYYNRGLAYWAKADNERAIADYSEAITLNPSHANAYLSRSIAYSNKKDYDRAIADCNEAIKIDPKSAFAYNERAWNYFKAGKAAQGLPDAERSLQLLPNDANALDTRGHIFEALGRREEAIADFRRALSIKPSIQVSRDALRRLGATP